MKLTSPHPNPASLADYSLGRLDGPQLDAVENHLDECESCLAAVADAPADNLVSIFRSAVRGQSTSSTHFPVAANLDTTPVDDKPWRDVLAPPQSDDEIGQLGPYRVLRLLGAGGMGLVFVAEDPQLRRRFALKVLRPQLAADSKARHRFLREARAMAALTHDHIVAVYQVGEERGVPYLAMPLLQGESLQDRLKRTGQLPVDEALRIGAEIAQGLAAAHAVGQIHRDIKPGNLWLEAPAGRVKILDFGLARMKTDDVQISQQGILAGTPAYIAPEQLTSGPTDARVDLFSLGCVLYEMLTGQRPFEGTTTFETLQAIATKIPATPRELTPEIPAALAEVVMRLLEKDPAKRPADAQAAAEALERIRASRVSSPPPRRRSSWRVAAAAAAAILLTCLVGGVIYVQTDKGLLEIVTDADDIKVVLSRNGQDVDILDPKTNHRLEIRSGTYRLKLPDGVKDVELDREEVELRRGSHVVVKVRRKTNVATGPLRQVHRLLGHSHPWVEHVALSPDNRLIASCGCDCTIRIWDRITGLERRRLEGHAGTVTRVLFVAGGKQLLSSGDDHTVRLWDAGTGAELFAYKGHPQVVRDLALMPDGKLVLSVDGGGGMRLWELGTGKERYAVKAHDRSIHKVAVTADGTVAITASSDGTVGIWDAATGKGRTRVKAEGERVWWVAFSPDGSRFVSGGNEGIAKVWETATGRKLKDLAGQGEWVRSAVFTKDGRRILAGGHSQNLLLWDVDAGYEILRLANSGGGVTVALTDDGRQAVAACNDGSVRVWNLPDAEVLMLPFDNARTQQQRWASRLGLPVERSNSLGMKLALIPPGLYKAAPTFQVHISKPYYLGAHEVTVKQFRKFVEETQYLTDAEATGAGGLVEKDGKSDRDPAFTWRNPDLARGDDYPVCQVSWKDATKFCEWLSTKEKKKYRLPTEAEWEWACRAGSVTELYFGDAGHLGEHAWCEMNSEGHAHPVGRLKPNAWGLYDLYGNAAEHCRDWIGHYPSGTITDYSGPPQGQARVIRGCGFYNPNFGSGLRTKFTPNDSMFHFGFRVCLEP